MSDLLDRLSAEELLKVAEGLRALSVESLSTAKTAAAHGQPASARTFLNGANLQTFAAEILTDLSKQKGL